MPAVKIIWSLENGGPDIDSFLDHGSNATVDITSPITLYVRHDGDNEITGCSIYMREWSGTTGDGKDYSGAGATPLDDFNEIAGWGDETDVSFFGGWQINMDAAGSFPDSNWPDESNKTTASGLGFVASSGIAISEVTAFEIKKDMSGTILGVTDGEIPTGIAPNYRLQTRMQIPASGVNAGIRQFEHVLNFTFTS